MSALRSLPESTYVTAPDALGLSTAHIGPHPPSGTIRTHRGGSYVVAKPPPGSIPQSRKGGGRRGEVWEFSKASRRRLMGLLASINQEETPLPYFVTLTYHNSWSDHPADWKAQLKALRKRMQRIYGPHAAVWRLEYQKRGAPHFHLLCFLDPEQVTPNRGEGLQAHRRDAETRLRNNIAWMWNEIVDPTDMEHLAAGTGVEMVKSWRGASAYAAKYMGKLEQLQSWHQTSPGRFWGVLGKELLPIEALEHPASDVQVIGVQRTLRRLTGVRYRTLKPLPSGQRLLRSQSFFVGEGATNRLLAWLGIIGSDACDEENEHRADPTQRRR